MRIRIDSIGCRLNISEIEKMARSFTKAGHRLVGQGDMADLYIFNSCVVTHSAARKSRYIIRQMCQANRGAAKVVVTGCYAQMEAEAIKKLGVDMVIGNEQKDNLPAMLTKAGFLQDADPIPVADNHLFIASTKRHTRAFIKVQDGCDNRCTFCIVTIARGAGRSRPLAELITEINSLTSSGYKEVVLSGVHLGSYGHDLGKPHGLKELTQNILTETDIPRLRLSSLEPWDIEPSFFELWQDKRLLPHLHLPLQSGCDATLRRMARHTNQSRFTHLIESARSAIPDLSITTDIIVGFPAETEAEFAQSLAFTEQISFSKLHIFRYSKREGTVAAKMKGQIPSQLVKERSQKMHNLNRQLEQTFRQKFVGQTLPVLWESSEPAGFGLQWSGLTGNYLRVITQTDLDVDLQNKIIKTDLIGTTPTALMGQLTKQ